MMLDAHTHNPDSADGLIAVEPQCFAPRLGARYAVGLHPWHAPQVTPDLLELLDRVAADDRVAAIGETGLDSLRGGPIDTQERLMEHHLLLAQRLGKPLVIHCVRTAQQVMAICRRVRVSVPCVIHGMRGNERVARALLDRGFYLSFGPRYNPAAVRATPLCRLLAETDDTGLGVTEVVASLAATLGTDAERLRGRLSDNLDGLLGLAAV